MATIHELRPAPTQAALSPLSPFARYAARSLAASAHRSSVDAEGIRDLFAGCEEAGYGFPSEYEAAVMAELAAIAGAA